MTRPRIAVVGGGVTGLAAAYELRDVADVTLFEATDRLGGKVFTDELGGVQVEWGPDSLLARDDEPVRLLATLGLAEDVVEPSNFGAWVSTKRGLKRVPGGFFLGIPVTARAIGASGLLSPFGIARAAMDLVTPRTKVNDDIALGTLIRKRFGTEVAEKIVAPLMSGIRAGDLDDMSADLAAPEVVAAARRGRSITLGLRRSARYRQRPRFIGLRRGMSSMVDALSEASRAEVRMEAPVSSIEPGPSPSINGERFDGAVITAPPAAAAKMLDRPEFSNITFEGVAVMNLVYPAGSVPPLPTGSGILFGPKEAHGLIACTWFTQKWPHVAPSEGPTVLRCVARPDVSEDAAISALKAVARARNSPMMARRHVWSNAFPIFRVGHRTAMHAAIQSLTPHPVAVAGAGYLATGLSDCLSHGRAAAREILSAIRP